VIAPNVSQYGYPVFMLIDLVAMTAVYFPELIRFWYPNRFIPVAFLTIKSDTYGTTSKLSICCEYEELVERPQCSKEGSEYYSNERRSELAPELS
jgi:hypothetical protein